MNSLMLYWGAINTLDFYWQPSQPAVYEKLEPHAVEAKHQKTFKFVFLLWAKVVPYKETLKDRWNHLTYFLALIVFWFITMQSEFLYHMYRHIYVKRLLLFPVKSDYWFGRHIMNKGERKDEAALMWKDKINADLHSAQWK